MDVDYYIIQVDKNATDDDLKKASLAKFKLISEGYEGKSWVLSDPLKRAVYDRYGKEEPKGQVPPPHGGGGTTFSQTGDDPNVFRSKSNPRTADDIFSEPSGRRGEGGGNSGMNGGSSSRAFGGIFGDDASSSSGGSRPMNQSPHKAPPVGTTLPCSLEDLYKGIPKKVKISREISDANGKTVQVEEILTIEIKPGWKKGTRITFPDKGNVRTYAIPADLVFIIDEKPHQTFTRDGDDLIVTQKISLSEALTGYTVRLTTLDGRNLTVPITDVINPRHEEIVPMEGMPISRDRSKKGNLRIKINIKFPARLTAEQKSGIKKSLALGMIGRGLVIIFRLG
ncbi:dnaJ homolog subfamily B member 1-like [Hibiscus syriacus]|uniref:dnaJ homolog subfamily B member 1-like n=1 Tax=Hibiscus syriacus TaxID=106335 RepID=UPI0019247D6C|nr:dnaJ homolog subfamily B member 1-like [Hibiscus syriacus]